MREKTIADKDVALSRASARTVTDTFHNDAMALASGLRQDNPAIPADLPTGFWYELSRGYQAGDPEIMRLDQMTDKAQFAAELKKFAASRGYRVTMPGPTSAGQKVGRIASASMGGASSGGSASPKRSATAYRHTKEELRTLRAYDVPREEIAKAEASGKKHKILLY